MALFTHVEIALLRREAATKAIHKVEDIEVWRFNPAFLDALEAKVGRATKLELTRTDGQLYVTLDGETIEAALARESLVEDAVGS
ncbi:YaeQ family protein [Hyalangium rubrum]|uniref:YaeQ family protein n=1 Tax=Hyalangium rubrum TaxID=3103134 RepID=A0ABU5HHU7_9BACT|nr:YaeQ family protein [Hyalangium sp. s54d21]MDY7232830.1 YaeQ family protein [Hyalangium sp. s54d21]